MLDQTRIRKAVEEARRCRVVEDLKKRDITRYVPPSENNAKRLVGHGLEGPLYEKYERSPMTF